MRASKNELSQAVRLALTLGAASTAAVAAPAFAQSEQQSGQQLETITVVGSRIKRADIETSQPVFQISREELQATGLTTVGDILQDITTGGASINRTFNNGGDGSVTISLRNLGSNRTLVLVNGRRWVTTLGAAVDLNTIPTAVIERIDILKDGASAVYGTDAIGGVVNIVLRENFEGLESSAYYGQYEEGDGVTQLYTMTMGTASDRGSVVVSASYNKIEGVFAGDRALSAVPLVGFAGGDTRVGASTTAPWGRFGFSPAGFANPGNRTPTGVLGTIRFTPGAPANPAAGVPANYALFNVATDGYNFAPDNLLETPQEVISLYGSGRYNLTDNITFRTEFVYNERRSNQQLAPMPLVFGPGFGSGLAAQIIIPANNFYNPFGAPVTRAQFRPTTFPRIFTQDVDTFYFAGGIEGSFDLFDRPWSWDVNYSYNDNEYREGTTGQFNLNRLATGLGPSFRDASGVIRCGTPTAPIAGCVPLNIFNGAEGFTNEMFRYASFRSTDNIYRKTYSYSANLTGEIFELPAGPVAVATGYEYRREFGFDRPDALIQSGVSTGNIRQETEGGFALDEFYGEFLVPILKDAPLAERLEFRAAARFSDYSNFGDTTNLSAGFTWKPYADLLVRGNYNEGFRAPSILELFRGQSDSFPTLLDPCSVPRFAQQSPETQARCRNGIAGIPGTPAGYEQANTQIRITLGGNPNLQPETAKSKTLGLVYSPGFLEGFDVSLDWYNIQITNTIGTLGAQFLVTDCYVRGNLPSCAAISRDPATGSITNVLATTRNTLVGDEAEGYDLTLNYRFDTDWGRFRITWDNAYVSFFGDKGQPRNGDVLIDGSVSSGNFVGNYGGRGGGAYWRLRSNLTTNWEMGDWGATLGARYFSDLDEDCSFILFEPAVAQAYGCQPFQSAIFPDGVRKLGATTYFDGQVRWTAPWNATVTVGGRNLFDRDPPVSFDTFANSFDPAYDLPSSRFWYVQYTQRF